MTMEPDDAKFRSKLDEASRKKAKDELNEINDKDRELAVQNLRKMVLELKWLKTPTDFEFLVRFLRVRKYSQLTARESIENYWSLKAEFPKFFHRADPRDPVINEILRSGFYAIPKKCDTDGCRVIIGCPGLIDVAKVKEWGVESVYNAILMMYEWVILDENVQVNGIKFFVDYSDTSLALATTFSGDQQKGMLKFFQKALPIRMKGMYLYNTPSFFDVLYAVTSPFLSQKMKTRMHMVGKNMTSVYEHIDKSVLPDEYLPDDYNGPSAGPMSKITDEMVKEMTSPEFVDYIMTLSSDKYGADLKKKSETGAGDVPVASFRKLNVD